MEIREINEQLDKYLNEEQLNEMAIVFGRNLGNNLTVEDGFDKIETDKSNRIQQINAIKRERITLNNEDPDSSCWVTLDKYVEADNGIKYQFALLWGEEDIMSNVKKKTQNGQNRKLIGHGVSHIYVNHKSFINTLKTILETCIDDIISKQPITLKKGRLGNGEYKYTTGINQLLLFRTVNYQGQDYIYLHTAYV